MVMWGYKGLGFRHPSARVPVKRITDTTWGASKGPIIFGNYQEPRDVLLGRQRSVPIPRRDKLVLYTLLSQ